MVVIKTPAILFLLIQVATRSIFIIILIIILIIIIIIIIIWHKMKGRHMTKNQVK